MNDGLLVFLATAGLLSIILVVIVWQLASTWRAKEALVREGEYRRLAESAVANGQETRKQLEGVTSQLLEVRQRLEAIEKTLTVID